MHYLCLCSLTLALFTLAVLALAVPHTASAQSLPTHYTSVEGMFVRNEAVNLAAAPAPKDRLHLSFPLISAREAGLKAFIASQHDPHSPNYRHWLTPQKVGQRFGAKRF